MSDEQWDDERLSTAFAERARPNATPPSLTLTTLDAVRTGRRERTVSPWRPWMAVAAVVVVGLGLVGLALPRASTPGPSTTSNPTTGASAPAAAGSPVDSATVQPPSGGVMHGLPVIGVDDAIAVRDSGVDDRELAVRGWYSATLVPCPTSPVRVSPLLVTCPGGFQWLTADNEPFPTLDPPAAPALHPDLDGIQLPGDTGGDPRSVLMLGHFDDRRSASCPANERTACADRFVVDGVELVDGVVQPISVYGSNGATPVSTFDDVAKTLAGVSPGGQILSMVAYLRAGLEEIEPELRCPVGARCAWVGGTFWRVQVLERDRVTTYVVDDSGDATWRIADDGTLSPVQPQETPSSSPSATVFGLPLLTVAEATAVRDAGVDDREIAVKGWLASVAVPCPSDPLGPRPPFGLSCEDSFAWLTGSSDPPGVDGPSGPSIRPVFQFADVIGSAPQQAVLVGHFDDRRSASCEAASRLSCGQWFIVDRTGASPDSYLTTYLTDETLSSTALTIAPRIAAVSHDGGILSMVVLPAGGIGAVEPSLGGTRVAQFAGIVWRAQVLEQGVAVTYLVPDGTTTVYQMTADGVAVLVLGPPPAAPPPSDAPLG